MRNKMFYSKVLLRSQPDHESKCGRRGRRGNLEMVFFDICADSPKRSRINAHPLAGVAPEFYGFVARPRDSHRPVPADASNVVRDQQPASPAELSGQRRLAKRGRPTNHHAFPVGCDQGGAIDWQFSTLVDQGPPRTAVEKMFCGASVSIGCDHYLYRFAIAYEVTRDSRDVDQYQAGHGFKSRPDLRGAFEMLRKALDLADLSAGNTRHRPVKTRH